MSQDKSSSHCHLIPEIEQYHDYVSVLGYLRL